MIKKIILLVALLLSNILNALQLGDAVPNFKANTTKGEINFKEWSKGSWVLLFSHPGDFTPVCTTELARVAYLQPDFEKRNVKLIGLSVDSLEDHKEWIPHVNKFKDQIKENKSLDAIIADPGSIMNEHPDLDFPIIADTDLKISKIFNMIHPNANPNESAFGLKHKATIRSVYIINDQQKIQTILTYPMHVGRNFDEILRTIDALQLSEKYSVATPANWHNGDMVVVPNHITNDMIEEKYGTKDFIEYQNYLRMIEQPGYYAGNKSKIKRK